jgi:hypothetical protein
MKIISYILPGVTSLALVFVFQGCCTQNKTSIQRPPHARGWQSYQIGTTTIDGAFVLNKGEQTDNGRVGVRVAEIHPAECSLFSEPVPAKVRFEFYRASDKKLLCTVKLAEGTMGLDASDVCSNKVEWTTVAVNGISVRDQWVSFDLRK